MVKFHKFHAEVMDEYSSLEELGVDVMLDGDGIKPRNGDLVTRILNRLLSGM